jgi:hypothetical protein
MKSIFDMGFGGQTFGFARPIRLAGAYIAQTAASQADRDQLLQDLTRARALRPTIDKWITAHPDFQSVMGSDADDYENSLSNASMLAPSAEAAFQAFSQPDPSKWVISTQQWNDAATWASIIGHVNDLIRKYTAPGAGPLPAPGTPGVKPVTPGQAPAAVSTGPNPLAIGLGAAAAAALLVIVLS